MKNSNDTVSGIEPETFRFVAQRLNRCATVAPLQLEKGGQLSKHLPIQLPNQVTNWPASQ